MPDSLDWELGRKKAHCIIHSQVFNEMMRRANCTLCNIFLPDSIYIKSTARWNPGFGAFFQFRCCRWLWKCWSHQTAPLSPTQISVTWEREIPLAGHGAALNKQHGFPLCPLYLRLACLLIRNYNHVWSHLPKECCERAFIYSWNSGWNNWWKWLFLKYTSQAIKKKKKKQKQNTADEWIAPYTPGQGWAHFSCKSPDSKYFVFFGAT